MAKGDPAAFFSYCREDSAFALRLAADLKAAGANVWLDQLDIVPGQRWDRAVEDALTGCPRMLVILSPASVSSTNVMDEVSFALEEKKVVIPVFYKDCVIPFRLRRVQYVDFRVDYARGLQELIKTLAPDRIAEQSAATTPEISRQQHADIGDESVQGEKLPMGLAQMEAERAEKQRLAQPTRLARMEAEAERAEKQRLAREEAERSEKQRLAQPTRLARMEAEAERVEKQRLAREEAERAIARPSRTATEPLAQSTGKKEFGELIGVRSRPLDWSAMLLFLVAIYAETVVWFLLGVDSFGLARTVAMTGVPYLGLVIWMPPLVFVICVLFAFAKIRNAIGAIAVASITYGLLYWVIAIAQLRERGLFQQNWIPLAFPDACGSVARACLFLAGICVALPITSKRWLGTSLGALVGMVFADLADTVVFRSMSEFPSLDYLTPTRIGAHLVGAAVFCLVFLAGLRLMERRRIRARLAV